MDQMTLTPALAPALTPETAKRCRRSRRTDVGRAAGGIAGRPPQAYTTGAIARMYRVSPRTATGWIDSGLLPGYRIPGSQDRRVTAEALTRFAAEHNLPPPPDGEAAAAHLQAADLYARWDRLLAEVPDLAGAYRHKRSGVLVVVTGVCLREEDCEPCVLYRHAAGREHEPLWCRPLGEFKARFEPAVTG